MWDYQRGDIVCTKCGLVIDKILTTDTKVITQATNQQDIRRKERGIKLSRYTIEYLKLLEKTKNMKGKVKVRINSLQDIENCRVRQVKVFYREFNEEKMKDRNVTKIMKIMSKYPKLKSRTDRAKLAIALITLYLITKSNNIPYSTIQNDTGLSRVHIRRLIREIKRERTFIEEVKAILK